MMVRAHSGTDDHVSKRKDSERPIYGSLVASEFKALNVPAYQSAVAAEEIPGRCFWIRLDSGPRSAQLTIAMMADRSTAGSPPQHRTSRSSCLVHVTTPSASPI